MTTLHGDPVRARAIKRAGADDDQADLLHAAELVITSALGSWTMLQRKMRLPQGAAQRVLGVLELHGVVGPEVAGHRRVLVEPSDLDATLARLATPPAAAGDDLDDDQIEDLNTTSPPPADTSTASDTTSPPAVSLVETTGPPPAPPAPSPAAGAALVTREPSLVAERQPMEVDAAPDDETASPTTSPRRLLLGKVLEGGSQVVTTLRQGEHFTARTARATARYGWVTGQGIGSWCRRATRAANQGGAREQVAMARRSGLPDELERWDKHLDKLRNNRIKRLMRLPKAIGAIGITLAVVIVLAALALLVVGGCAWIVWDATGWHFWWSFVGQVGYFLSALVVIAVALAISLTPIVTVRAAHTEGMKVSDPPRWLLSLDERHGMDALITPARVVMALRDCGIPALRKYIESSPDGGGELLGTISPAGCGTEVDVRTPTTVPTTKLLEKRRAIAEALDRYEHELYMTSSGARVLRFWIAEPGVLDQPIGPSPLVSMPAIKASMKTGHAPFGQNLRGDLVGVSLWQRHLLITGLSNHGKSLAGRALCLWLAYDVTVEFRIADLKGFGDWDCFEGLATCYIKGPTDDQVIEATEMLEGLVEEMERRLASGRTDWDPLVGVADEAQVAYMCQAVGPDKRPYGGSKNTSRFFNAARKILNQGRAVNVLFWQFTQDPTDQNLPEIVREAAHIRMCLVVGTPAKSKMALGEAAVDGGAAPHLLRRDIDKGTVVMHGGVDMPRGESSITVRTYFVDDAPAWQLARGAIEKRRKAGRSTMVIDAAPVVIDSLQDIHDVMQGQDRVLTLDVLARLKEYHPAVYEDWTDRDLADTIREYNHLGLDRRKRGAGQMYLLLEEIQTALRDRQ